MIRMYVSFSLNHDIVGNSVGKIRFNVEKKNRQFVSCS